MPHDTRLKSTGGERPELHIVAHSHWDREWYHTEARFRQRLVALIDALLDDRESGAGSFLLDGQAVLLQDYLRVRPERVSTLSAQVVSGRIEAGPWYVLADNLIPSGESIIRNLQAGRRVLALLGGHPPSVAYCPDTFGHPAALTTIARGFGLHAAIVWRGFGGNRHPKQDAFRWQAPDGAGILTWHLPRDGYEFGSALPVDDERARERWRRIRTELLDRSALGISLLTVGADHHARQPMLHVAIDALATAASTDPAESRWTVRRSSLQQFIDALTARARDASLPFVEGELRDSYGYTWTLQGTLGTRAADKRRNAGLERALLRDVEPWCALAVLQQHSPVRADGSIRHAQLPPLLATAWETLLQTHPHDTLCGCSLDEVALAMQERQRAVAAQAVGLRAAAIDLLTGRDPATARATRIQVRPPTVLVRNRSARARAGVAELRLVETLAHVNVGPGGAGNPIVAMDVSERAPVLAEHRNADRNARHTGSTAPIQNGAAIFTHLRRESPQHYPSDDIVRVRHSLAWIPEVPAFGLSEFDLTSLPTTSLAAFAGSNADQLFIGNDRVRIECSGGMVRFVGAGRTVDNLVRIESTVDAGDSYTPSLRGVPRWLSITRMRIASRGPLRASIDLMWRLSAAADSIASDVESSLGLPSAERSTGTVSVRTRLSIDAGSDCVRIELRGNNRLRNHRLRFVLAHDVVGDPVVRADAALGHVVRSPIQAVEQDMLAATEQAPRETVINSMPLHRWICVTNANVGATIISDGLTEAEPLHDGVAVTLLRAIGELSRADLPERPGHAGWPEAVPLAQSQGPFRAKLGWFAHEAWSAAIADDIERTTEALLQPLTGESWREASTPTQVRGPKLTGTALRCSAFMPAQDADGAVLRVVNESDQPQQGSWRLPSEVQSCTWARLDETPVGEWQALAGDTVAFEAPPRAVLTLRIRNS